MKLTAKELLEHYDVHAILIKVINVRQYHSHSNPVRIEFMYMRYWNRTT